MIEFYGLNMLLLNHVLMAESSSYTSASVSSAITAGVTTASASSGGQLSTTSASEIVPIFQFKAQYPLSDITSEIRDKMTMAVAKLLQVNTGSVILSFTSVIRRVRVLQQQEFVLVSVGLVNFQGSRAAFASMITQENVNFQMAAAGLKSVDLLTNVSGSSTPQGTVCGMNV
jgi:hypothetical protein